MSCPEGLGYWTADEVAECLDDVPAELRSKLWRLGSSCLNQKPLGGDGSNGTTEEPIVSDSYGNNLKALWPQLEPEEQEVLTKAYEKNW